MKKKGFKIMAYIAGALLIIIGSILIYWNIPYSPNQCAFKKKIEQRLKTTTEAKERYTSQEIERLPVAMQRYFNYIGCVGKEKHNVVNIQFEDVNFQFDKSTKIKMDYNLWLFADQPYRAANIVSSRYGVPFEGQDYMTDTEGGMKGILGKAFQIFDTHDEQMYEAGLISLAIEGIFNPAILLSDYITYEEIDENHVKATISYNGKSGTGIYTIEDDGQISVFESDRRQKEIIDGEISYLGWRTEGEQYKEVEGIKVPTVIRAITIYPEREEVYFEANKIALNYYK